MRRLDNATKELEQELIRVWQVMRFSSHQIGNALGVRVLMPYLENLFSTMRGVSIFQKKLAVIEVKNGANLS